jgi:YHS domain-containing protein
MKKNSAFLILCIIALTFSANAQLKVNSTGKVGIGIDPDATYNLRLNTAIFVTGYTYPDIIIGTDPVNYGRAVYPSQNNMCRIGTPNNQFAAIYAQYHYSGSTYHFSDSRLKENFRVIEKPLEKLLLMNGLKYDFINQGNDTISNEKEKQELLKMQKDKLGFLAQDLEKILPEAVLYKEDEDRYYIEYKLR